MHLLFTEGTKYTYFSVCITFKGLTWTETDKIMLNEGSTKHTVVQWTHSKTVSSGHDSYCIHEHTLAVTAYECPTWNCKGKVVMVIGEELKSGKGRGGWIWS